MEKEIIVNFMYNGGDNANGSVPTKIVYDDKILNEESESIKKLLSSISDDLMKENESLNIGNIVKKLSTKKGIVSVRIPNNFTMYI